ncbi:hypothetical protein [Terrisporobacter glycolicus]|nr:hypothetical protein [Terrisporobacter glycolicus]
MKKVVLKNNTINVLLFMMTTHVFASENERDKFIDFNFQILYLYSEFI